MQRFKLGEQDFLPVLDAERELVTAENQQLESHIAAINKLINLYTSLGGGWQFDMRASQDNIIRRTKHHRTRQQHPSHHQRDTTQRS